MKTNFYKIKLLFAWCLIIGMFNAPLNADQNTDIKDISPEDMALNSVGLVSRDQLKIEIPKETLEQKVAILNDYNDKNVNIKFDNISLGSFQPNDNLGINAMWGIQNISHRPNDGRLRSKQSFHVWLCTNISRFIVFTTKLRGF